MLVTPRPDISKLTTLGVGGLALAEITLEQEDDFALLSGEIAKIGGTPKILGGGSNLLAQDGELPLVLLRPKLGRGEAPVVIGEEGDTVLVRIKAGLTTPALVSWCGKRGLSGLEGLVGIPGSMGGALAMNAGAYGCETGRCLREITAWTPESGLTVVGPEGWYCAYRSFSLVDKPGALLTGAVLALEKSTVQAVEATIAANLESKKATQPLGARTAGCAFKNPAGHSAGKLLDEAGMRGKSLGGMWFTDKHANFLANKGNGKFHEAMALVEEARQQVARLFGIHLDLELRVWTCPS